MLDERFRRRVGELLRTETEELDESARERIVASVASQGPALVRRARLKRAAARYGLPGAAAAAAAIALVMVQSSGVESKDAGDPATRISEARDCAKRSSPQPAAFEAREGRLELHLGRTADAVATPGSVARLTEAAPCRTVITLDRGMVVVDAKDLGGGELIIAAGDSNVRVRGTLFGVARERDTLTVEVASGMVEVASARSVRSQGGDSNRDQREHRVGAGQRLLVSSVGVATGRLAAGRAAELERVVREPKVIGLEALSPVEPPTAAALPRSEPGADRATLSLPTTLTDEPSPSELLARAETLRRAGDYAGARALYRQAGSTAGPTAEAAWLALARMELGLGDTVGARRATEERRRRFGRGTLGPEALWIDVRTHQQAGEAAKARQIAEELASRWPESPQAAAARRFLKGD